MMNIERDIRQTATLESLGWRVIRVWEHELEADIEQATAKIAAQVRSETWVPESYWRVFRVEPLGSDIERERRYLLDLRNPGNRRTEERYRSFTNRTVESAC